MTEARQSGRRTKISSVRIKVMAVVLSVVAFVASLTGVAIANPSTRSQTAQPSAVVQLLQQPRSQPQLGLGLQGNTSMPQKPRLRPMTCSRGS